MKISTHTYAILLVMLAGLSIAASAQAGGRGVSYSPDQWPTRWSSAIQQQQNGNYPTRQLNQSPPPELPAQASSVSEQDLFSIPSLRRGDEQSRQGWRHRQPYGQMPHYRRFRDNQLANGYGVGQGASMAAFAYYGMPAMQYGNFTNAYSGFPYGTAPMGIDPVLGHPGMGIPIMPGTPFGYPMMGLPIAGYPGGVGIPFGRW